jgi:hypothetical protein
VGSWRWTPRTAHDAILGRPWRGIGPDGKAKQAGGRHIAIVARMVQWPLRTDDAVKPVAVVSKENVQEWKNNALSVRPNRCITLGMGASGRTSSLKHYR